MRTQSAKAVPVAQTSITPITALFIENLSG
jgi:hypothetical protein